MDGKAIRTKRKALGLTQAQFAAQLGLSRDYVGLIERDRAPVEPRTTLAVQALRAPPPDPGGPLVTTDPMEQMVEQALRDAGIRYITDHGGKNPSGLDFHLPDIGVDIEVKRFHSDRIAAQMARAPNVIAVQGEGAIKAFCDLLRAGASGL